LEDTAIGWGGEGLVLSLRVLEDYSFPCLPLTGNLATRDAVAYKYLTSDQAEDRRAACLIFKQKQQNVS
jgi:hypothetical protein